MSSTLIADVLFTKTQQRVLGLLYGKPDCSFYTNEIMRYAEMGRGTISRELERLASSGLVSVTRQGNQLHYQANKDNPVYTDLLNIIRKTFAIVDVIKAALIPVNKQIELAFIFGSIAKGEDTIKSDVDLMLVSSSLSYADVMRVLSDAEDIIGRPINPSLYTAEQVKNKLDSENAFLSRVMEQPKIWIKGQDDDIRDIGKSGKNRKTKKRAS